MINVYTLAINNNMSEEEVAAVHERIHNATVALNKSEDFKFLVKEVIIGGIMQHCLDTRCTITDPDRLKALDDQLNAVSLLNNCLNGLSSYVELGEEI